MAGFFYHCTINTADIIIAGKINAATSMQFSNVSLFRGATLASIKNESRYYNNPDQPSRSRLGESVYPIKAAFCFESRLNKHRNVIESYKARDTFDSDSGLVKKGINEYLFPGSINIEYSISDDVDLWCIRIPTNEPKKEESYLRLIALMYLLDIKWARICHGINSTNSFNLFHLVKKKLEGEGYEPNTNFKFTNEVAVKVNRKLFG
jgi:hypothetical protein